MNFSQRGHARCNNLKQKIISNTVFTGAFSSKFRWGLPIY